MYSETKGVGTRATLTIGRVIVSYHRGAVALLQGNGAQLCQVLDYPIVSIDRCPRQ